ITCTPPSGSLFPVGRTPVSCVATDADQRTSTCSFTVTVTLPPMLTAKRFVAFGDSITAGEDGVNLGQSYPCGGFGSLPMGRTSRPMVLVPVNERYPGVLQQLLDTRYPNQSPIVDNEGCPGEAVTNGGVSRLRGVLHSGGYDVVLIME